MADSLKNTTWFGNPKDLDKDSSEKLRSFLSIGTEIQLDVLNDVTKAICIYEYGPCLSLLELEKFMMKLTNKIPKLRPHNEELFYQLFNAICFSNTTNYMIQNACVLIFCPPMCILLKFGDMKAIKFVVHLDNNSLYILGEDVEPIPFLPESSALLHSKYIELKSKIAQKIGTMMINKISGFETKLTKDTALQGLQIKSNVDETKENEEALKDIFDKVSIAYKDLQESKVETQLKIKSAYENMIGATGTINPNDALALYKQSLK